MSDERGTREAKPQDDSSIAQVVKPGTDVMRDNVREFIGKHLIDSESYGAEIIVVGRTFEDALFDFVTWAAKDRNDLTQENAEQVFRNGLDAGVASLRRNDATTVEAGVAQNVREGSGQSTPETASAAVQAAEEHRACNPVVPGSTPGASLDGRSEPGTGGTDGSSSKEEGEESTEAFDTSRGRRTARDAGHVVGQRAQGRVGLEVRGAGAGASVRGGEAIREGALRDVDALRNDAPPYREDMRRIGEALGLDERVSDIGHILGAIDEMRRSEAAEHTALLDFEERVRGWSDSDGSMAQYILEACKALDEMRARMGRSDAKIGGDDGEVSNRVGQSVGAGGVAGVPVAAGEPVDREGAVRVPGRVEADHSREGQARPDGGASERGHVGDHDRRSHAGLTETQDLRHALVAIGIKAQTDGNETIRGMVSEALWGGRDRSKAPVSQPLPKRGNRVRHKNSALVATVERVMVEVMLDRPDSPSGVGPFSWKAENVEPVRPDAPVTQQEETKGKER